jgi:hypothetical protein
MHINRYNREKLAITPLFFGKTGKFKPNIPMNRLPNTRRIGQIIIKEQLEK